MVGSVWWISGTLLQQVSFLFVFLFRLYIWIWNAAKVFFKKNSFTNRKRYEWEIPRDILLSHSQYMFPSYIRHVYDFHFIIVIFLCVCLSIFLLFFAFEKIGIHHLCILQIVLTAVFFFFVNKIQIFKFIKASWNLKSLFQLFLARFNFILFRSTLLSLVGCFIIILFFCVIKISFEFLIN